MRVHATISSCACARKPGGYHREMASERTREPEGIGAWRAFLRAHAAVVHRLEDIVEADQRLPLAWYDVLLELNSASRRRLRMQELAERVVLSRSRVSRVVDEMTRAGLARREADPTDGRAAFAVITPEGRQALRRAAPVYLHGVQDEFLSHLTQEELRTLERAAREGGAGPHDRPTRDRSRSIGPRLNATEATETHPRTSNGFKVFYQVFSIPRPRSSGDRASASGAVCGGSNPPEGAPDSRVGSERATATGACTPRRRA